MTGALGFSDADGEHLNTSFDSLSYINTVMKISQFAGITYQKNMHLAVSSGSNKDNNR